MLEPVANAAKPLQVTLTASKKDGTSGKGLGEGVAFLFYPFDKKLHTTTLYSAINHPDKERRKSQGRLKVVNVCWESPQPAEQPEKLKKTLVLNSTSSSSR